MSIDNSDPIFALIEEHRYLSTAYDRAVRQVEKISVN
jgi:hypothetical protein